MRMKPLVIALVTARAARDLDADLLPLESALHACRADAHVVDWDDPAVDWSRFDIALLRSTWDYTMRFAEFLAWAQQAGQVTNLLNPLPVIRWNTDKHYLAELAAADVPVVPSTFIEPGDEASAALADFLHAHAAAEFVVKPAIGAGSRDAQRYGRDENTAALTHARRLLDTGRSVLLQPYLARVDEHGETALIFFDGAFSHAIRKGPLLRRGEGATRALFAAEHITARAATTEELRLAEHTLDAIPFPQPLLYARVDLIHDADGAPRVLELELTEPSLFFAHAAGSAERFAAAILQRTLADG
jgi:glutathione synthase/RimK-type ligase-like ATP-grasp enzyme